MSSVPRVTRSRSRKSIALLASGATLLAVSVVGLAPGTAMASSHREAPLTAADPLADNTDVYAFVSPDDANSVTLIANWIPFEEPNGGPNFYPFGTGAATTSTKNQGYTYDIKIDNNGSGNAAIVYRWTFSSQDTRGTNTFLYADAPVTSLNSTHLLFKQTYAITVSTDGGATFPTTLLANAPVAPSDIGPASMPNYQANLFSAAVTPVTGGGQSYAGQADDPFFLDLRVFDLLYGGNLSEVGQDTLRGYNVNTVSLKLPKSALALKGDAARNPVIGVWSTTNRQSVDLATGNLSGAPVQVSRLGQPLVNEVVIPSALKDTFNSIPPTVDATVPAVVARVVDPEVPKLVQAIYGAKAPTGDPGADGKTKRTDIAEIFLTGVTTKLDGKNFYKGTLGAGTDKAPIGLDLNSQLLNADSADPAAFQPSEMLRLNMSIAPTAKPSRLGVAAKDLAGFPNGRRLADDVVDIELAALGGFFLPGQTAQSDALTKAGFDKVDSNALVVGATGLNANGFLDVFPYIAPPNNQGVNTSAGVKTVTVTVPAPATATPLATAGSGGITTPTGGVDTGAGGSTAGSSALPLVTGTAAVLLLAAGGASILGNRRKRAAAGESSAE